ncbi:MAG: hypothetical protein ABI439_07725 [Rhodospirillales bacterium]
MRLARRLFVLVAALSLAGSAVMAGDPRETNSRIEVKIDGTHVEAHLRNSLFAFIFQNPLEPADRGIILRYEVDLRISNATEGEQGQVSAQAFRLQADGKEIPSWTGTFPGTQTDLRDQRLIVSTPGCCGALSSHTAVSLGTGKVLYTSSGSSPGVNVATIEIPNTGALGLRYVAVHGVFSSTDDQVLKSKTALALISYSSPAVPMQKLMVLQRTEAKIDDSYREVRLDWVTDKPNDVQGRRLVLWKADGNKNSTAVAGATLRLQIGDQTILLPVVNDRFDLPNATVPPSLVLIQQNLE